MKVAIVGGGSMGKTVLKHLKICREVSGISVFDPDAAALEFAAQNGATPIFDASQLWKDASIPLVFITAPNAAHRNLALAALHAGKAVLLEKPIATTLEDSELIVSEAERLGGFLQIGFELRYSKLYTTVKDWIDQGLLGTVVNVHGAYICSEFHGKHSWRNRKETGGSMFGEKLSHYVDLPRWWIGSEVADIYTVSAPNVVPYFEVHDNYHSICRFVNGAVSELSFSMFVAKSFDGDPLKNSVTQQLDDGHELRFTITGTKGAAQTNVFARKIRRWEFSDSPQGLKSALVEERCWSEHEDHRYFHNTEGQTHDVVSRVLRGLPPATSARDSLQTMMVCSAAEESNRIGDKVVLSGSTRQPEDGVSDHM